MLACEGNHEECVETLLSVPGLNVNAGYYVSFIDLWKKSAKKKTVILQNFVQDLHPALTLAAEKGFIGIVKKLLTVADLNVNAIHQVNIQQQVTSSLIVECSLLFVSFEERHCPLDGCGEWTHRGCESANVKSTN